MCVCVCVLRRRRCDILCQRRCPRHRRGSRTHGNWDGSGCRPPPAEFTLICDAAMTAAKSHLYMLGRENLTGQWATTPLRKYDPSIDTWSVFLNMLSDGLCQLAADSNDSPALNCLLSPCLRKQTHLPEQVTAEQLRLPGSPQSCRAVAQAVTNVWLLHAQV